MFRIGLITRSLKIQKCGVGAHLAAGRLALATLLLICASPRAARGYTPAASLAQRLPNLPLGSRCLGSLPCPESGDYGIHLRVLGVLALDENHQVSGGRFEPGLMLSAMEVGECGVSFPLRFYELGLPVPERVRLFCKASLPKGLLSTSRGAAFVAMNLASGPFDEAHAPGGPRATTVDVGAALGGDVVKVLRLGTAAWATLGEGQPELHAGAELLLRTDLVTLFGQAQFENRVGCRLSEPLCAWGFLGLLGVSLPLDAAPTSAYVGLGRGQPQPFLLVALQGGATYDVAVRKRVGDGHQAVEHWWLKHLDSYRYRLRLQKLGYRDPIVNARGGIDEDDGSALIGWLGQPHPTMPGYILSWEGLPVRVGSHVYIREDWPLVTSEDFPGWVLTYLPQVRLQQLGQPGGFAPLDDGYFNRLQRVREEEERRLRDTMRDLPTPWLKAGFNALVQTCTGPILLLLSGASPETPSYGEALRQTRLAPYRAGQEEQKGETAETVIGIYGSALAPLAGTTARALISAAARELAGGLTALRSTVSAAEVPSVLSRLGPRLNPLNYRWEVRGLGSNFANTRLRFAAPACVGGEAAEVEAGQRAAAGIAEAADPIREIAASAAARTRTELIEDLQAGGLRLKGRSPDGRFAEFVDGNSTVRAKIHPPDAVTTYAHLHLYDSEGNALDSALRPVSQKSPDAHIRIREP